MTTREAHKQSVIAACREMGAYEVVTIVANWMVDELLVAPHVQQRQDVQDRVLKCARDISNAARKMLI